MAYGESGYVTARIYAMKDYRRPVGPRPVEPSAIGPFFDEVDAAVRELLRAQEDVNKRIIEAWCAGWIQWPI